MQRTKHSTRGLLAGVSVALIMTCAVVAPAQSTADKEQAKQLVAEGRNLRDNAKDHKGALERFAAAYKLVKTPIIGLDLAREHVALSQLVEAFGVCDEISRLPTKDTESKESKQARVDAASLGADVKPRIPKLSIKLKPHAESPAPTVELDGAALLAESLLVPRTVNPGTHTVTVRVEGAPPSTQSVTLAEGESKEVLLEVPVVAATAPVAPKAAPELPPENKPSPAAPPEPSADKPASALPAIGLVTGGVGVVTAGFGLVLYLSGSSTKRSLADEQCTSDGCPGSEKRLDYQSADGSTKNGTLLMVVGGALTVGGIVLFAAAPSSSSSTSTAGVKTFAIGPTGFTLAGRF